MQGRTEEGKRREKKVKREEKKTKRKEKKEKQNDNFDKSHYVDSAQVGEKFGVDPSSVWIQKGREAEIEQIERSSLTEEHEQPFYLHIPSSSSDSTENSNKRMRHNSPTDDSRALGNIIRIRLAPKKKNEYDASLNKPQQCSTTGRINFPLQQKDEAAIGASQGIFCPTARGIHNHVQGFPFRSDQELISSAAAAQCKTGTSYVADAVLTSMQRLELQVKTFPPELNAAHVDYDDLEWLFQSKNQDACAEKRFRSGSAISHSSSSTLWPCAQYLREADVYALPFAVPF